MAQDVETSQGASKAWFVGVDVGGTKTEAVLVQDGEVRASTRIATRRGVGGVVEGAAEVVRRVCGDAGIAVADLIGVGVGVPGVVDHAAGTVTRAVNLGIHDTVPLGAMLSRELRLPVAVENDLNAAAIGAAAALGRSDLAYLSIGTGVAAGLILDGRLRRGHRGAAGEVGHLPFRSQGPQCACGQRGCIEVFGSGGALDRAWPTRGGVPAPVGLFRAAAAGDPRALAVRRAFADAVAYAVRALVVTCDPEVVVLGGGVARLGVVLRDVVVEAMHRLAEGSPFLRGLRIEEGIAMTPDERVPSLGAAQVAVSRWAADAAGAREAYRDEGWR